MQKPSIKRTRVRQQQISTLKTVYRYRFVTAGLLVGAGLFADASNARRHLRRLQSLALIGVRYDTSSQTIGRHATYYLMTAGIRLLRSVGEPLDEGVTHLIARDAVASARFEKHCLVIFEAANLFHAHLSEGLQFLTKSMLYEYDNVIHPYPDGFLRLATRHFYLEYIDESLPMFAFRKRLNQYIEDYDASEWEEHGSYYPPLLLITESDAYRTRIITSAASHNEHVDSDIPVYGVSLQSLRSLGEVRCIAVLSGEPRTLKLSDV